MTGRISCIYLRIFYFYFSFLVFFSVVQRTQIESRRTVFIFFWTRGHVIFKNRAGVLYRDLKHEATAECFRPDKVRTASFLNVL